MSDEKFCLGNFSLAGQPAFAGLVMHGNRVLRIDVLGRLAGTDIASELVQCRQVDDLLVEWDRCFPALQLLARFVSERQLHLVQGLCMDTSELRVHAPVRRPAKIVCHAQNYADHVAEMRKSQFGAEGMNLVGDFMGEKSKTWPYAFLKAPSALAGACDDIVLPAGHPQIDWEAEMALVIGNRGKRLTEGNAMRHVAGFMTFNDVSCRDNQWRPDRVTLRSDWFSAKSFDTFAPSGPYFVPKEFVANHLDLRITLKVNGQLKQDGNTAGLIFSPEEQLAYFSSAMTWEPGDILATGTPGGTGQGLGEFLQPGDIVETEVEGLGIQRNCCVADSHGV